MRAAHMVLVMSAMLASTAGCASYEYNLTQPAQFARQIGQKSDEIVAADPLQYKLRTVDNRLVMRIYNPTSDPIELIGARSTVVDAGGQSHPLRSQTIAPASFIKLIFPPIPPPLYGPQPAFGVGVGYGYRVDALPSRQALYAPDPLYAPRYCVVLGDADNLYWTWPNAEGAMRLTLVFQRQGKEFRQAFVFSRQKR